MNWLAEIVAEIFGMASDDKLEGVPQKKFYKWLLVVVVLVVVGILAYFLFIK